MTTPGPTELPTGLLYGTVRWLVVGVGEDSLDVGDNPDPDQIQGMVTFTATPPAILYTGQPEPMTVLPRPVKYPIKNGKLVDVNNDRDVTLVACDSPGTSPQGWSYTASYELEDGYTFGSFSFLLPAGETVDLTTVYPLPDPTTGILYIKGDKGDPGEVSGVAGGALQGNYPNPELNEDAIDEAVDALLNDPSSDTMTTLLANFISSGMLVISPTPPVDPAPGTVWIQTAV